MKTQVLWKTMAMLILQMIVSFDKLMAQENLSYGIFGVIHMYHPKTAPNALMLFVSGDGGWELGVVEMAKTLAQQGALVAGIDAKHLKASLAQEKGDCSYPAGDFENLSMFLQKKYKFPTYQKPILVGFSYGATLTYGLLAQAPSGTFKGGIAMGFCPDIELRKPLCKGSGLKFHVLKPGKSYYLDKVERLSAPFIVLNGVKDQICNYAATNAFLKGIENAELVSLAKVGHGFTAENNWMPQFHEAFEKILKNEHEPALLVPLKTELPIRVFEPKGTFTSNLVLILSGDGGWTSFDQGIANNLVSQGYRVVGLDCQKYFWNQRSPNEASTAISKVLNHYQAADPQTSIRIIGYSFGACIAPFIVNRFSPELKKAVNSLTLISPSEEGDFEIHLSDMLNFGSQKQPYEVLEEFKRITGIKKQCIFGTDENAELRNKFKSANATVEVLPGGHHYNNDYKSLVDHIINK